jgi:hypothetical protein
MKLEFKDAVRQWVGEFNAIPQALIEKAYNFDEIYEMELTPIPKKYECDTCSEEFDKDFFENEAGETSDGDKLCPSCLEGNEESDAYIVEEEDYDSVEYGLPMWGTMWTFSSSLDSDWALNHLDIMADLGFKVYESDELGVFFGINGAGYDFYEAHWNELYKARGLRWHREDSESA